MDLSQFDNEFAASETISNTTVELPAGKYTMKVVDTDVFESRESSRPYFKIILQVVDGEHKGKKVSKLYGLDDPQRFKFLKGDLCTCGLLLGKLSELPSSHEKIRGKVLNVTAKVNDKFTNYYINGIASPTGEAHDAPKGDVPF